MMRAYLRTQVHKALDGRLRDLEAALASGQIAEYQRQRREFLRATLGEMPPRTPLNARITGTIDEDGFVIEKVLFESWPGFHVTGACSRE